MSFFRLWTSTKASRSRRRGTAWRPVIFSSNKSFVHRSNPQFIGSYQHTVTIQILYLCRQSTRRKSTIINTFRSNLFSILFYRILNKLTWLHFECKNVSYQTVQVFLLQSMPKSSRSFMQCEILNFLVTSSRHQVSSDVIHMVEKHSCPE